MRILLGGAFLACFGLACSGTASAQTAPAAQKAAPTLKSAPLAAKPTADLLAAKRRELAAIDAQLAPLKREEDSVGDLSAEKQKRMRVLMDRRSKVEQQISEMQKKASDTQSSIVSNTK